MSTDPGERTVIAYLPQFPNVKCEKCQHVFPMHPVPDSPVEEDETGVTVSFTEDGCPECGSHSFRTMLFINPQPEGT